MRNEHEPFLRHARRGSESAFLRLFDDHHLPLYRFAWRLTGSKSDADDIVPECFLALLRPGCSFDPVRTSLRSYLFGAVRNQALIRLRRREQGLEFEAPDYRTPETDAMSGELANAVAGAIGELPETQREVLLLAHYEQLSLAEIADITQLDVTTVKSRLQRARATLRETLRTRAAKGQNRMNDTELDRLLDAWKAPAPPPSLRQELRTQFTGPERRQFVWPWRWVLILAVATAMLAIGMEQSSPVSWSRQLVSFFGDLYRDLDLAVEAWPTAGVLAEVRNSDPKAYVDGQLVQPPRYGRLASWQIDMKMDVDVPGEGVYSVALYKPSEPGWVQAGHIHKNVMEFQAGGKTVRIVCNKPLVSSDLPVFARRISGTGE